MIKTMSPIIVTLLSLLSFVLSDPSQSSDATEIRIWSCESNGVNTYWYDPALITWYAQTASEIIIRSNLDPKVYVKTAPNSYALDSLRKGLSLSYTVLGDYAITTQWVGPMVNALWNSCGTSSDFISGPYWACNNGNGLHLRSDVCGWTPSGTPGGLSVFLKRNLTALIPIWRCYSDGKNVALPSNVGALSAFAAASSGITIYSNADPTDYVTTTANSYALQSLASGITLSFTTSGGYANTNQWVGSKRNPTSMMWDSCGSSQGFLTEAYWSCNNGNGLHLTKNTCGWTSGGGTLGGFTVAVTPKKPAPYRYVRIWHCDGNGKNFADFDLATIKNLAKYATAITIMSRNNPAEYVTTSSNTSYALTALRQGLSLSYTVTGGYAVVNDWVGTMTSQIWNSCGSSSDFITSPYWSCNNGNGLHLRSDICGWTSSGGTVGGIGVYVHVDNGFTAALQGTAVYDETDAYATETIVRSENKNSDNVSIIIGAAIGSAALVVVVVVIVVVVIVKSGQSSSATKESIFTEDYLKMGK